jgi:hypothetical protein
MAPTSAADGMAWTWSPRLTLLADPAADVPSAAAEPEKFAAMVRSADRSPPPVRPLPAVICRDVDGAPTLAADGMAWTWSSRLALVDTPAAAVPNACGLLEPKVVVSTSENVEPLDTWTRPVVLL